MTTKKSASKLAFELNGSDVGRHVRQKITDWTTAVYDRKSGAYTTPPTITHEWFEIVLITHKKNGSVRIRTKQREDQYLPNTVVTFL